MPNGGQQFEYDHINVHDVVMSEIPWLCTVVDGSTLAYGTLLVNPMLNPFLLSKHTPQTTPQQPCVTSTMAENRKHPIICQGASKLTP